MSRHPPQCSTVLQGNRFRERRASVVPIPPQRRHPPRASCVVLLPHPARRQVPHTGAVVVQDVHFRTREDHGPNGCRQTSTPKVAAETDFQKAARLGMMAQITRQRSVIEQLIHVVCHFVCSSLQRFSKEGMLCLQPPSPATIIAGGSEMDGCGSPVRKCFLCKASSWDAAHLMRITQGRHGPRLLLPVLLLRCKEESPEKFQHLSLQRRPKRHSQK